MDMGVIKNRKAHYKSRLNAIDSDLSLRACDIAKSISLSDALYISKLSWDAVEGKTIAKCFQKGGFLEVNLMSSSQDDASNDDNMLDDVSLPSNMSLEEFENFIDIANNIPVSGELSDAELLEIARKRIIVECDSESDPDDECDNPQLSLAQKKQMVDFLRIFIPCDGIDNLYPMLHLIENKVHVEALNAKKQTSMNSFFV